MEQRRNQDQDGTRQQQQFDAGSRQAGGGSGADSSFAGQIREHMQVIGPNGEQIGIVDHIAGDQIKLARDATGEHSYLPLSQVAGIEGDNVRLRERGDTTFGMEGDH